jgi:plasmid stability protein
MVLHLNLPAELEQRLRQEADRRGKATESVALGLLDQHLPPQQDLPRATAIALLEQWMDEDATLSPEEAATNSEVLRTLDADRPSYRKLFTTIPQDDPE